MLGEEMSRFSLLRRSVGAMTVVFLVTASVVAGGISRASAFNASSNSVGPNSARGVLQASGESPTFISTFKSLDGGMCLDVNMEDNAHETWVPLTIWDCNFGDNQRFAQFFDNPGPIPIPGRLVNQASQKCMDAGGAGEPFNGQDVGVFPCKVGDARANQNFSYFEPSDNSLGYAEIHAGRLSENKCVEIRVDPNNPFAQPDRGTKIQLWDCNGQPWQQWKLFSLS
jgi:hypothetical protein